MARSILAVLVGYLLFAVSAYVFFQVTGRPPHREAPLSFMVASIAWGAFFAVLGGYVAAWLGRRRPLAHGLAVAALLALGATVSWISTAAKGGAVWTQVAALVLMAPCAALGGWLRLRLGHRGTEDER